MRFSSPFATAYFTLYSYIEPYLGTIAGFSPSDITMTLVGLGVFGFLGSVLFSRLYGIHRRFCLILGTVGLTVLCALYLSAAQFMPAMVAVTMLLGTISTLFNVTMQAELIGALSRAAAPVAMSIFSGLFNVGIGSGTFLGGVTAASGYLSLIGLVAAVIAAISAIYCVAVYLPALKRSGRKEA